MTRPIRIDGHGDRWLSWRFEDAGVLECRGSALRLDDGGVWLFDPFDGDGLDEALAGLGKVRGVVVLLDRHMRDAGALAERHGVELWVPHGPWRKEPPTTARRYGSGIPGTPFELLAAITSRFWLERVLWWPQQRIAVLADAVGAAPYFLARPDEPLGVHPMLRPIPPKVVADLRADVVLMGHGAPVTGRPDALRDAVGTARRRIPRYAVTAPQRLWRWARS